MEIDAIDELDVNRFSSTSAVQETGVPLDEREDAETIRKTKSLDLPDPQPLSSKPLTGRVTEGNVEPAKKATSLEQLQEILLEQPSYLVNIRNSVAQILAQLSRIAEKDRTQIDEMKKKYENSYKLSAGLVKDLGWDGLIISSIALVPLFLVTSPHQFDREMGNQFATQFIPSIGRIFTSSKDSDIKKADALSGLIIQEYSAKTSKSQSESGSKQEITSLLEKVVSALKEAARAG